MSCYGKEHFHQIISKPRLDWQFLSKVDEIFYCKLHFKMGQYII